jgi:hypothetical protein
MDEERERDEVCMPSKGPGAEELTWPTVLSTEPEKLPSQERHSMVDCGQALIVHWLLTQ